MNKCNVQFPCCARENNCNFWVFHSQTSGFQCHYYVEGYCTNKEAQIKALIDEGFSVVDEEKEKQKCEKAWSTFPM